MVKDNNAAPALAEFREQDRFLPTANIARIMKRNLPRNAKISKEAKEIVQECVSEFICFVTSEASDKCQQDKRKTINGNDVLFAMEGLGFEKYVDPLKLYLGKYREKVKVEPDHRGGGGGGGAKLPEEEEEDVDDDS
ncbi:hypothetical protein CTAYLR_003250 [Chrysophaeum taylorii]|uniref:Transcription factor CBF/NF-Y/archaeal histone domain-containing protein n=1 Tax=Chrysophaeum taylorii TaxID=2483200 RepID=A0AAD7XJ22_9STRA|nr:hypothetical protein CTAYLR_003250 [Chrysophaeum taylorii]